MQGVISQVSGPKVHVSPPFSVISGSSASSPHAAAQTNLPKQSSRRISSLINIEEFLRHQLGIPRDTPVDLWALQDPPDKQKPNQLYSDLIKLAILGSPNNSLTFQEICQALINRFEWYKDNSKETAWKVYSSPSSIL
jgi:hypothetical protein